MLNKISVGEHRAWETDPSVSCRFDGLCESRHWRRCIDFDAEIHAKELSPMLKHSLIACAVFPALLLLASGGRTAPLDDTKLRNTDQDTGNWLMYGRTYDDHRFSPLNQINEKSIGKLGLAWSHEFGTTRGLEGSPLVEDGIIYAT